MTNTIPNAYTIFETPNDGHVRSVHIPPQTDTAEFLTIMATLVSVRAAVSEVARGNRNEVNTLRSISETIHNYQEAMFPPSDESGLGTISMAKEQRHQIPQNSDNAAFARIVADLIRSHGAENRDRNCFHVVNRLRLLADIVAAAHRSLAEPTLSARTAA